MTLKINDQKSPAPARIALPARSGRGAPRPMKPGQKRVTRFDGWWPVLFVAPLLAGVLLFYIWPILQTFYFSFTTWGVFGGSTWSGLANYARLITDPKTLSSQMTAALAKE